MIEKTDNLLFDIDLRILPIDSTEINDHMECPE